MADIQANVDDVVQALSSRIADLSRENAILIAQLSSARQIINILEGNTPKDVDAAAEGKRKQ